MRADIVNLKNLTEKCTRNEPVYCTNACPLHVDVKSFLEKIKKDKLNAAYTLYEKSVLFPRIVSAICDEPCGTDCIRRSFGGSIAVKKIEQACCRYTTRKNSGDYYVPAKEKKIGIVGGGLSGMGCAMKLSRRGYQVELYEKENRLGGMLWNQLAPIFTQESLEEELKRFAASERILLRLRHEITSIDQMQHYDAVYIATGKEGSRFGLQSRFAANSLVADRYGVFLCPEEKTEDSSIEALRYGILVADEIEAFLKVGRMEPQEGIYERKPTNLKTSLEGVLSEEPVKCEKDVAFTRQEAVREAERCLFCGCSMCHESCEMLAKYKKFPEKVIEDVNATLNVMEGYTVRIASRQINSCNLCGSCKQKCPDDFDYEEIFLESRRQMQKAGDIPPAYHDFWMRDMEHALSEQAYTVLKKEEACQYLYFPGCQMGSSDPEYVSRSYEYLEHCLGSVGVLLSCCGAPAYWAGDQERFNQVVKGIHKVWMEAGQPTLVAACASCKKLLEKSLKDCNIISVYEVMAQDGFKIEGSNGMHHAVFDPCASRSFSQMQDSVRQILQNCGIRIKELPDSGENARCCGYGGQIHAVDRDLVDKITTNRVRAGAEDYVTYCTNCRDSFREAGKRACHVLDLFWSAEAGGLEKRMERQIPGLSQRRRNREETRRRMEAYFGVKNDIATQEKIKLYIDENLAAKMNRELILEEDAEDVIRWCEQSENKLMHQETGRYIGHLERGCMTYWAEYRSEGEGFRLFNVYCHRMYIEEG